MLQVAAAPDIGVKGANAQAHVEKNFSLSKMWAEYECLFQELLLKRKGRAWAPAVPNVSARETS
jgi:hypothetical protein